MSIPEDLRKEFEWVEDELKKMNEGDSGKQPEKSEYLKSLDECSGSLNELKEALFGKHPRRSAPNRSNPKSNEGDSGKYPEKSEYPESLDEYGGSLRGLKEALFGKRRRRPTPVRRNPKSNKDETSLWEFIITVAGTFAVLDWLFPKK